MVSAKGFLMTLEERLKPGIVPALAFGMESAVVVEVTVTSEEIATSDSGQRIE